MTKMSLFLEKQSYHRKWLQMWTSLLTAQLTHRRMFTEFWYRSSPGSAQPSNSGINRPNQTPVQRSQAVKTSGTGEPHRWWSQQRNRWQISEGGFELLDPTASPFCYCCVTKQLFSLSWLLAVPCCFVTVLILYSLFIFKL